MTATYVLDTNSFRVFGNYYPESFPSFWEEIEKLAADGTLVSCREVAKELELQSTAEHLMPGSTVIHSCFSTPRKRKWNTSLRSSAYHTSGS